MGKKARNKPLARFTMQMGPEQKRIKQRLTPKEVRSAYRKAGTTPIIREFYLLSDGNKYSNPFAALFLNQFPDQRHIFDIYESKTHATHDGLVPDITEFTTSEVVSDVYEDEYGPVYYRAFLDGWDARGSDDVVSRVYMIGYNDGCMCRIDSIGNECRCEDLE